MKCKEKQGKKYLVHKIMVMCVTIACIFSMSEKNIAANQDEYKEFKNPEDIILTAPKNGYTTTAENISILGACDYRYPLSMNGKLVETTKRGFFTIYYPLQVGENKVVFENNQVIKELTIIRRKPSKPSGASSEKKGDKIYTDKAYGRITSKYAMPRSTVKESDLNLYPISRGTVAVITGENGSYYKLENGWYVSKSSMTKFSQPLKENKISDAEFYYEPEKHLYVTKFRMDINTLYKVEILENEVRLTLYHTTAAKKITVPDNELIESVEAARSKKKKTVVYTYKLKEGVDVFGYDIFFNQGVMKFELKAPVHFKERGTLSQATIFLDAGHGGQDSGALGPLSVQGPVEKDFNLAIAAAAKEKLEALGANVVMSRTEDSYSSLSDRVSMIRNLRPDLSISIHANSLGITSDYRKSKGLLTYYSYHMGKADSINQMNSFIAASMDLKENKPRSKSLSLTRITSCPAVLIETQFMSNPDDYEFLIQEKNQKAFGTAIANAVLDYFNNNGVFPEEYYVVKPGDNLTKISRIYQIPVDEIAEANGIKNVNCIYIGQRIKIPYQ